jgi:CDP-Glycerol:Poly(glycerophosphate) glycerophosphotransferase
VTFRRRGVPFVSYRDFVDPSADAAALRFGEELLPTLGTNAAIDRDESIAYMGLSFAALVSDIGEPAARERFAAVGRHAFLQLPVLRRVMDRIDPRVVVATNSPKSERAAILVGNERDIPTVIVPDLLADPAWETYGPFEARWYAAMNPTARANLVTHHGADPDRVVVTGQPAFDKSQALNPEDGRRYTARMTGWPGRRPFIVVTTTWDQLDLAGGELGKANRSDHALRVVELVARLAGASYDVIVKPHPSEPAGRYAASGSVFVAAPGSELDSLLAGADAMIAAGSSASVVDGLSMGRRTLLVQLDGKEPLVPAAALGVPIARSAADLQAWLEERAGSPPDGGPLRWNNGAAIRVAELIERLAEG